MIIRTATILLFLIVMVFAKSKQDAKSKKTFPGQDQWEKDYLNECYEAEDDELDEEGSGEEFVCLSYLWNYELVNLELMRAFPPILAYRGFVPKKHVEDLLRDIKTAKARKTSSDVKLHATEIVFKHKEKPSVARLFNRLKTLIPFMNFDASDPWQVLIFKKNQHYAPRYDFLGYGDGLEEDTLMNRLGNRFATFMITLKSADQGGATVFPMTGGTYHMEPGDAILWTNMDASREKEMSSLHGDCPVKKGERVIAILRLREREQYLLKSVLPGGFFNFEMLARPNLKYLEMTPKFDFDFVPPQDFDYPMVDE
ncbi:oxidoreductase, 2OG-Fe(II) oxygenase family protein [Teladorsagia circumcincta]|uniref:Oxidoreductase, 2OG-Fe(II) oxygenase family protein n=1 Tax=Teladorsagia circumcincta TaxID=45464 RepID=A0A2G9UYD5_TELCI|nr:oxidoreductase, 2OG-Fe(II) oxygenase family protein [Teladorsagia circumcincta]